MLCPAAEGSLATTCAGGQAELLAASAHFAANLLARPCLLNYVLALRQSEVSLASLALAPANGHATEQSAAAVAAANTRTVTGVLTSRPTSRDIKIDGFSMGLNGVELIQASAAAQLCAFMLCVPMHALNFCTPCQ